MCDGGVKEACVSEHLLRSYTSVEELLLETLLYRLPLCLELGQRGRLDPVFLFLIKCPIPLEPRHALRNCFYSFHTKGLLGAKRKSIALSVLPLVSGRK